jgi:ketosteroid isomerase-like protein
MNHILGLLLIAIIPVCGCASNPASSLSADQPEARAQILTRLNEVFDAAEKKDLARLDSYHLYGPKFTKYAPEAAGRLDGAAARQGEHEGVSRVDGLDMRAEDLKIDVFGQSAVATFRMAYSFKVGEGTTNKAALSTLVFVRDHGAWKIVHEHFSPAKVTQ